MRFNKYYILILVVLGVFLIAGCEGLPGDRTVGTKLSAPTSPTGTESSGNGCTDFGDEGYNILKKGTATGSDGKWTDVCVNGKLE